MSSVRSELTVRVAALSSALGIPVAYENNNFTKPASNAPFIEMFLIPATTVVASVDATRQRELGYMQLNVWHKTGNGTQDSDAVCDVIKAAFPVVPKQGTVSIESPPSVKRAILDMSGYRIVPITIQYRQEQQTI